MNDEMNKDLDYDMEVFDEANDRANKLFEARIKQTQIIEEGEEYGEGDID